MEAPATRQDVANRCLSGSTVVTGMVAAGVHFFPSLSRSGRGGLGRGRAFAVALSLAKALADRRCFAIRRQCRCAARGGVRSAHRIGAFNPSGRAGTHGSHPACAPHERCSQRALRAQNVGFVRGRGRTALQQAGSYNGRATHVLCAKRTLRKSACGVGPRWRSVRPRAARSRLGRSEPGNSNLRTLARIPCSVRGSHPTQTPHPVEPLPNGKIFSAPCFLVTSSLAPSLRRRSGANGEAGPEGAMGRMPIVKKK